MGLHQPIYVIEHTVQSSARRFHFVFRIVCGASAVQITSLAIIGELVKAVGPRGEPTRDKIEDKYLPRIKQ